MIIEINKERIQYLLSLYKMTESDLLFLLNKNRKKTIKKSQLYGDTIEISILKRIDKIFEKGLNFYQDYSPINKSVSNSVFFRKQSFRTKPNMETIKVVNRYENIKQAIDAYNKLSQYSIEQNAVQCSINDSPFEIAVEARELFFPNTKGNARQFLVQLIKKCADNGVYVFEYIETWNKKERTNVDGFFLKPNVIVLKHNKYYKREIFTLAHELGHYLPGIEEIEAVDYADISVSEHDATERWCNDFAYYFIMGDKANIISSIADINADNDYCFELLGNMSKETHISRLALFTRLFLEKKLTYADYCNVKDDLDNEYKIRQEKEKQKEKKVGIAPKPIISPLFLHTMQFAYFKGVISEKTFCTRLNIKPNKFERVLWQY